MQTRIISLVCKRQRLHPKSGQSVIAIVRFYSNFCIRKSDCMFAINQRNDAGIRIIANVASKLIELTLLLCRLAFFFCIRPAGPLDCTANGANRCACHSTTRHMFARISAPDERRDETARGTGERSSCSTFRSAFAGSCTANDARCGKNIQQVVLQKRLIRNLHISSLPDYTSKYSPYPGIRSIRALSSTNLPIMATFRRMITGYCPPHIECK